MRILKVKTNQICPRTKEFFKRRFSPKGSRHGASVAYVDDFEVDFSTVTTPSVASSRRESLYEYVDTPTAAAVTADAGASASSPSAMYAAHGNTYSARNVDPSYYYNDYYESYRCDDDDYPCGCCCYGFFSCAGPFCCGSAVHDEQDADEKKRGSRRRSARRTNSQIKTSNNANANATWESSAKTDYNPHRSLTGFVLWCRLTWVKVGRTFR